MKTLVFVNGIYGLPRSIVNYERMELRISGLFALDIKMFRMARIPGKAKRNMACISSIRPLYFEPMESKKR
jgi:hypothetical protein